jgi:hypothetical protein
MKHRIIISILATILLIGSAFPAQCSKSPPETVNPQPLTYANIVSHFKAAHLRVTEVQNVAPSFPRANSRAPTYNYGIIIVENSDEDVQLTFYLTDAHEMNWVTEFLDARFFARAVKQKSFLALTIPSMMFARRKSGAFVSIFIAGSHAMRRSLSLASHQFEHRKVESRF